MKFIIIAAASIVAAVGASTEIPRLSIQRLKADRESGTHLHDLLSTHGMLRVGLDAAAAETRRAALTGMCQCSAFADDGSLTSHPVDMEKKVLNDRTERRTVGTASFGLTRTLDLPVWLADECGEDAFASFEDLRDVVAEVVDLFVAKLDDENDAPSVLTGEKTYREALSAVNHLEHFHVYEKPGSADDRETLKFHTDGGFFLVFVPSMDCHSYRTDSQSFFLEGSDEPLQFEDDEVIIMMGAGSQYSLNSDRSSATPLKEKSPFVAANHALRMKAGVRRSWYGKMHLLPTPDLPFGRGLQQTHSVTRAKTGAYNCNNETVWWCWSGCAQIPDKPAGAGDDDYSLYCVTPDLIEEEDGTPKDDPDGKRFTAAFDRCGYGSAHNHACKGRWAPVADHPDLPTYELVVAEPEHAFVLLGPTGDNALRTNGVWQGLYESYVGGVWNDRLDLVNIHPTMNTPHTEESLYQSVIDSITPLYEKLLGDPNWKCGRVSWGSGCEPETFWADTVEGNINVQDKAVYGRDPEQQCGTMVDDLADYRIISVYLSIPPYAFGDWATATANNWGADRLILAAEKPFGESTEDAEDLYEQITVASKLPADQLLLVDHWLSFFMIKNLPTFRETITDCLGIEWDTATFSKIVITEHETRGLEGRGGFFDGVGQVRDLFQSHVLQTLGNLLISADSNKAEAKLEVFDDLSVRTCSQGQYKDWLLEKDLGYHAGFADSTLSTMFLDMHMEDWKNTALEFTSGKLMGTNLYTVQMFQRDGPGVLTINYGAEEVGLASIIASHMPVVNDMCIDKNITIPKPGFVDNKVMDFIPIIDKEEEEAVLVSYNISADYFPTPYAVMLGSMINEDYTKGFVTYPQVHQSWVVITAGDDAICLDPPGGATLVYEAPDICGNTPPQVCYTDETVQDVYDIEYACTEENDVTWKCLNFYQDKCGLKWDPPECDDWTPPGVTITVGVVTDNRPHETSWTLVDVCPGGGVIAARGGYDEANEHVHVDVRARNSRYLFSILDTGGDGLCCKHGGGFYKVLLNDDVQIEGAEFGVSEDQYFGLDGCPGAHVDVEIGILFDGFPEDLSWELMNTCNGGQEVIAEGRSYGQDVANKETLVFSESIDDGEFTFVIKDMFGDGLCCSHGDGEYSIFYKGKKIITSDFKLKKKESQPFGAPENCPPAPPPSENRAQYSPSLGAPKCMRYLHKCTTLSTGPFAPLGSGLLNGKKRFGEPNGPNTLDTCTDGDDGVYETDESVEAISVESEETGYITAGGKARIVAKVYSYLDGAEDRIDFYCSDEVDGGPSWKYISTASPSNGGLIDVASDWFTVPDSETQAVRVVIRWAGENPNPTTDGNPSPCPNEFNNAGKFSDVDDLVFMVAPGSTSALPQTTPEMMTQPLETVQIDCVGILVSERCEAAIGCEWTSGSSFSLGRTCRPSL